MRRKRRNHSPAFEAKVALAAVQGDRTSGKLAHQFNVHRKQITQWERQLVEGAAETFDKGPLTLDNQARIDALRDNMDFYYDQSLKQARLDGLI